MMRFNPAGSSCGHVGRPFPQCDCERDCFAADFESDSELHACVSTCSETKAACELACGDVGSGDTSSCKSDALVGLDDCLADCDPEDGGCLTTCQEGAAVAYAGCDCQAAIEVASTISGQLGCRKACCQVDPDAYHTCSATAAQTFATALAGNYAAEVCTTANFARFIVQGSPTYVIFETEGGYFNALDTRRSADYADGITHGDAVYDCEIKRVKEQRTCEGDVWSRCRKECDHTAAEASLACEAHFRSDTGGDPSYLPCIAAWQKAWEICNFDCCSHLHGRSTFDRCALDCHFDLRDCQTGHGPACQEIIDACTDAGAPCDGNPCISDPGGFDCAECRECLEAAEPEAAECVAAAVKTCHDNWKTCMHACDGKPGCDCYHYSYPIADED